MWVYAAGSFAITLFNLLLWGFTFTKRRLSPLAKAYFWWSFYITLWSFGYGLTLGGFFDYQTTLWINKFCQAMATMIGPFFFRFGCCTADVFDRYKKIYYIYLWFGIINAIALFFTPYYVKGLWSFGVFRYQPLGGPLYIVFTTFFFWCTAHSFIIAAKKYRSAVGRQRKQIKLFLLATGIAYSGGGELFLQGYGIPVPSYGIFPIFIYVIIIAYAIQKYQFMEISTLLRNTVVFVGLFSAAFGIFALITFIGQKVVLKYTGLGEAFGLALSVFLIIVGYDPLRKFLVHLTDRFLFQKKYDYKKILKDASSGISQIKSLHELLSLVVHFITMRIRVNNAAILVHDEKNHYFQFAYSRGYPKDNWLREGHIINLDDPLIEYLSRERAPLEIEHVKEYAETGGHSYDFQAIKHRMEELKASLAVPSFLGQRFLGTLLLGEKKSGDFYTDEDQAILFTIGQESAIAIENARLYDEAIEKAKELELVNTELNSAQTKVLGALKEAEVANKQLKQTQVELIEAKKRALLAGISSAVGHEIRNPLTPIMGHLYYVLKSLDDANHLYDALASRLTEAERERFLAVISTLNRRFTGVQRGSERIRGVVNTLINLVKERSDTKAEVQLKLVIASALEEVRFQTYWDSLTIPKIVVDIPADLPFISGITQDLQGVFVNLIINSLHAMEKTLEKQITIKAKVDSENSKMIRIDFTDNGCGISKELQNKIFEHGFTTKGEKGTGIGLFYCKDNIERVHGGTIAVRSEIGIGTSFMIRLPIFQSYDEARGSGAQAVGT